ncbi:diaminopimelate epimerase [Alkanindiges illinoisensis]|uniref:Diaminopimelate epimerase n=1 Tax=Alkanindiges illinoisensis TaxID=197183 RepID=A0A4Y7XEF0_9GAMM|nr:diaminopimelate epimerase [Alkanindiges illinoisensis]TEU30160.1 diaminopimelate epimerase [Alkanindiges illinoisensis]
MRIQFSKMHGLGNDFMVIDLVTQRMPLHPELIRRLAHRNFGIGFDQMLIVEAPERPDVDFKYRIFNADGSEVEQCGNGVRCFARFVHERHLTKKAKIRVETKSGVVEPEINNQAWVRVNMGEPRFLPDDIPFKVEEQSPQLPDSYPVEALGQTVELDVVNMGNPHAVLLVDDIHTAPVDTLGPVLESHVRFPQRVNVGFMQIVNRGEVRLRVFERGVGETLACGTGACAAAVSGIRRGLLDPEVRVYLAGGPLLIQWQPNDVVWMTGPTATTFEGTFNPYDFYVPEQNEEQ